MNNNGMKRFVAALLVLCLMLGNVTPAVTFAEELDVTEVPVETVPAETAAETEAAVEEEIVVETTVPQETVPAETVPETTVAEETVPVETESEETVPTETVPAETVPEETAPAETVPEETVPEETVPEETVAEEIPADEVLSEEALAAEETLYVDDYYDFVKYLKQLEAYAANFSTSSGKNKGELILNFIRTGVERYNESLWPQLAGQEITAFVNYVATQDTQRGTTAMALRNIKWFKLPNGNQVDFGHMFGTLNIAYINVQASADLGGWAGDICDLLTYSYNHGNVPAGTIDEMAAYVKENCFGVDADDAFGMDDFYGDLDALYLVNQMKAGVELSAAMESYFTEDLDDADRSAYFMNTRFKGLKTREDVREAVYNAYKTNIGLSVLEADRGIDEQHDLRQACCYAFADYVFEMGGDRLEGDTGDDGGDDDNTGDEGGDDDDTGDDKEEWDNPYYSVFSSSESTLAPGIVRETKYARTGDNKQNVFHIATIDVSRDDVSIYANYRNNDPTGGWGMSRVTDQMAAAQARHSDPANPDLYIENFTPIMGVNGDFYNMSNGKPSGALVMEGVQYSGVGSENFFAILEDGTPVIGTPGEWKNYEGQIKEAIGGSALLVKNGQSVFAYTNAYYVDRAPRTCVGITADGKVVLMVLDGRQEPYSAGGNLVEVAQIMLDAGCVVAMNLDGGGSSTFAAKPEGSDTVRVLNSPSDGYARSVSSSLMVVSTAKISNEFAYASVSSEYSYLTVGTSLAMEAVGVSESGGAAEIPEDAVWQVSDEAIGSVTADGVFTALDNGTVDVQLVRDGTVVGSKTLQIVIPDKLQFEKSSLNAIYEVPLELPLIAYYNGNPVAYNFDDVWLYADSDEIATIEGVTFTGHEISGIRNTTVTALLMITEEDVYAEMKINLFKDGEAIFDFEKATAGDRQLAWNRVVTNSTLVSDAVYQVLDPENTMQIQYTFALDMTQIDIPAKLSDIVYMLPGGDQVDATAWDFLLQLAERVSVKTEVSVVAQFDSDLDVDITGMTVVNDYFKLKSVELDETTNTVTMVCGWVDQTQAIDPATANPICILSGIKATPKDNASWNADDQISVVNVGEVKYNIFLRANALYSFAQKPENQETYGLIPFEHTDIIINGATEKGASFGDTYTTFEDSFVMDKTNRQGWVTVENHLYYFVDNVALEEGIYLLTGYEDPTKKYYYYFAEDGSCDGTITGLFELDGNLHYAIAGEPMYGWQSIPDNDGVFRDYFFDRTTGIAVDGQQKIDGYNYIFTNCILTRGDIVKDSKGYRYMWAGAWVTSGWTEIDGEIYYCQKHEYFQTGMAKRFATDGSVWYCLFADDGRWMREVSGFYEYPADGYTYWIQNGFVIEYPGVVYVDGNYYYFNSYDRLVKNTTTWISKPNGLIIEKSYVIDADGKIQVAPGDVIGTPPEADEPGVVKNGIVEENGELYYYVNGTRTYGGLVQVDGDFYYVNSTCKVVRDCTYWITKTNGLMPEGYYTFGPDGKMIIDKPEEPDQPEEPEIKNGFVEEDGELYYYVDGVKTYAGLIQIDGYYYYVNINGIVIRGRDYWVSKTNGLLEEMSYTFDEEGRLVFPEEPELPEEPDAPVEPSDPTEPSEPDQPEEPEIKNGIVEENGNLYYYVDGVRTFAGVIVIDGEYYYVNASCRVVRGCKYWVSKTNGLLSEGIYTFDADGKIVFAEGEKPAAPGTPETPEEPVVKNGIVEENGDLYYYVDSVLTYAGLIQIDGEYYYVNSSCRVVHGRTYWVTKTNGLLPEKSYTFADDGKIVFAEGEKPTPSEPGDGTEVKNGIVQENGKLYYYVNGVKTYAGLIQIDGYYYYVKSTCEVVTGGKFWITKTNGLMAEGIYTFDAQGRMITE